MIDSYVELFVAHLSPCWMAALTDYTEPLTPLCVHTGMDGDYSIDLSLRDHKQQHGAKKCHCSIFYLSTA